LFVLPEGLPLELTPLAFLVGKWEGTGVISYKQNPDDETPLEFEFKQRVEFAHDGSNCLTYISSAELIGNPGNALPSEIGYWRIARPADAADNGPAFIVGQGEPSLKTHEDLEKLLHTKTLRNCGMQRAASTFLSRFSIRVAQQNFITAK